jgi:RNA polymerase sigma-70 factor, ECF subfamily
VDETAEADQLHSRLEQGDPEALAELFARHRDRLWRTVSFRMDRRLAGRIDPDDVLQEAYVAMAGRLGDFADRAGPSPFVRLRTMVMQCLIDQHRHHLGAQMRDAGREAAPCYPQTTSFSMAAQFVARLTSPSQAAARAEMFQRVEQAVDAMDPLDREVLALRHFEELGNRETAEVLGIQQKAASIRYVRAIRRLRAILGRMPGFLENSHG